MVQLTSATLHQVALLDKFLCRVCNEVKAPNSYSNKELNEFRSKWLRKKSTNFITANLRCRGCSGDPHHEAKCSACELWKPLDEYSKNQRRGGVHRDMIRCITCTQWKESTDVGTVPNPQPNSELAPDEEQLLTEEENRHLYTGGEGESDDEYSSDFGYSADTATVTSATGNLAIDTEETSTVSAAPAGNMGGYMPKYLRDTLAAETTASSPVKAQQSFTNPMDTRSEYESTPSVTGTTVSMCSDLSNSKNPYQDSAAVIKVLQNKSSTTSNRNPSTAARRVPLPRENRFPKAPGVRIPTPVAPRLSRPINQQSHANYYDDASEDEM